MHLDLLNLLYMFPCLVSQVFITAALFFKVPLFLLIYRNKYSEICNGANSRKVILCDGSSVVVLSVTSFSCADACICYPYGFRNLLWLDLSSGR